MPEHKEKPQQKLRPSLFSGLLTAWILLLGPYVCLWLPFFDDQPYLPALAIWLFGVFVLGITSYDIKKRWKIQNKKTEQQLTQQQKELTDSFSIEKRKLEKELKNSITNENVLRQHILEIEQILDGTDSAICFIDNEYTIRQANKALADFLNQNKSDLIGNKCFKVWQTPFCGTHKCPLQRTGNGERKIIEECFEIKNVDGEKKSIAISVTPFKGIDDKPSGIIKTARLCSHDDMQFQKTVARQAHDINNALTAVIGHTELSIQQTGTESPVVINLTKALRAAERGQILIKQLSFAATSSTPRNQLLSLTAIINEIYAQLQRKLSANIELKKSIMPGYGMIMADPTRTQDTIMHLCLRVTLGMEENGGILELKLEPFRLNEKSDKLKLSAGEYLLLRIIGNSPITNQKDNDPKIVFETAKKTIMQAGGNIFDEGAETKIYFPSFLEQPAAPVNKYTKQQVKGGNERILFVDDEDVLISMTKQYMDELGYHFDGETSSTNALKRFTEDPDYYDLVITDQTMPDLSGLELAESMLAIRPALPVILYTGYSNDVNKEQAKKIGVKIFLMKPVSASELARSVRTLIDNSIRTPSRT